MLLFCKTPLVECERKIHHTVDGFPRSRRSKDKITLHGTSESNRPGRASRERAPYVTRDIAVDYKGMRYRLNVYRYEWPLVSEQPVSGVVGWEGGAAAAASVNFTRQPILSLRLPVLYCCRTKWLRCR